MFIEIYAEHKMDHEDIKQKTTFSTNIVNKVENCTYSKMCAFVLQFQGQICMLFYFLGLHAKLWHNS